MSESLWGVDYARSLPVEVAAGVHAELGTAEDVAAFFGDNYAALFGALADSQFATAGDPEARERYLTTVCDIFVFRHEARLVGLFIGNPVDWSSYYIRSTAFLEEYQGRALYQRLLALIFAELSAAGVGRVTAETAPSNRACVVALTRLGFYVSGSALSERWGALTQFTKHLDASARDVFRHQFCFGGEQHHQKEQRLKH